MSKKRLPVLLVPLFLSLAGCYSLAADITPPPNYQSQLRTPTEAVRYPLMAPDPVAGAAIYADKCAACHGEEGLGDGPQANELPNPVAPIGDPALARQASPAAWYQIVSEGNIDRYMPPFISLSERQRWDVLAYVYSLSTDQATLESGSQVYQANCAECHGEAVEGTESAPALTTPASMAAQSANELFASIPHSAESGAPDFETALSARQRWSVVDFLRGLTFLPNPAEVASPLLPDISPTAVPAADLGPENSADSAENAVAGAVENPAALGIIAGRVQNASGAQISQELEITLRGFDNFEPVLTRSTTAAEDGSFEFQEVEMPLGRAFVVTVDYQRGTFSSDIVLANGQDTVFLPVDVYETSTDTSVLQIEQLHVLLDFIDGENLRVAQLLAIANPSSNLVIAQQENQPVLEWPLPAAAANLQFQEGELGGRFVRTADGFGDTRAVVPGSRTQILLSYDLPLESGQEITAPPQRAVQSVVVLVPEAGVQVNGSYLTDNGLQEIQGQTYRVYSSGALPAGAMSPLTVSGRLRVGRPPVFSMGTPQQLAVGFGALGLTMLAAGAWLYQYRRQDGAAAEPAAPRGSDFAHMDAEDLMDAIIALDDRYKAGALPREAYWQRRTTLKEQLEEVLGS